MVLLYKCRNGDYYILQKQDPQDPLYVRLCLIFFVPKVRNFELNVSVKCQECQKFKVSK